MAREPTRNVPLYAVRRAALLVTGFAGALSALAGSSNDPLAMTARLDQSAYVSGQEMRLTVVLRNDGTALLPVLRADSLGADFMRFDVSDAAGRPVPPHVKRTPIPRFDDPVLLAPGERVELELDFHDNYPFGLPPGDYDLVVAYDCSPMRFPEKSADVVDLSSEARPIRFRVTPRSPEQERQCDALKAAIRATDDAACVRVASEGIVLDPSGLFARRLRIELAGALWRSGRSAEAGEVYAEVVDDAAASGATRRLARFNLGLVLRELGDTDAAIRMMRQVPTRAARHYADEWSAARGPLPGGG